MQTKWILLLLCGINWITTNTALATIRPVVTLSGGPSWYQAGQTQTLNLQPGFDNTYVAQKPQQILASGEIFLGIQGTLHPSYFGQLGLAVATTSHANLQGHIWEAADPAFDNFTYLYRINHTHLALKGKLLSELFSTICLPYLNASVGIGFNRSTQYTDTPLLFEALPEPAFASYKQTSLTYALGAGLQKILNHHWSVGLGYEWADWGRSSLARAPGQTVGTGLSLNHLYTNQLQFNFSYIA